MLKVWVKKGFVRRVFRGVFAPAFLTDTLDLRAACAGLLLPPHCVAVERTAAWLHGIDLHSPDERFTVPELEVVSLTDHGPVRRTGIYGANRDLKPRDVMQLGDVRLTTPVRTALDLGCLYGELSALAALDAFERHHELTKEDLERELPRFRRRRGVVQLRRLIPLATPLAESQGESWLRGTLIQNGFTPPQPQIEIWEHGVLKARIDMGYRHLRIGFEYFGEEFHLPEDEGHDLARIRWLEDERGWRMFVVRKDGLSGAARRKLLEEVAEEVAKRTRPRGKRRHPRGERYAA